MPRASHDTFDESRPDLTLPPFPGNDSFDDSNILTSSHEASTSGITAPSSAPIRTPRTSSNTSLARLKSRGVDETPMPSKLSRDISVSQNEDDSVEAPINSIRVSDSVIEGLKNSTPVTAKPRAPKHATAMTLREHEQAAAAAANTIFELRMRVHFLEEQKLKRGDEQIQITLTENVALKVENAKLTKEKNQMRKDFKNLQSSSDKQAVQIEAERESYQIEIQDLNEKLTLRNASTSREHQDLIEEYEDLRNRHAQLQESLEVATRQLEDTTKELDHLQDRSHRPSAAASARIRELEDTNRQLQGDYDHLKESLDEAERICMKMEDQLQDERNRVEELEATIERQDLELQRASHERSASRAEMLDEMDERENLEVERNRLRDQVATLTIMGEQSQDVIDQQADELQIMQDELAKSQKGHFASSERQKMLQDTLEKRSEDLTRALARVDELETDLAKMHDSFETAVTHLEKQIKDAELRAEALEEVVAERDSEIDSANKEIDNLGQRVYDLEEENEKLREQAEKEINQAIDRAAMHEEMSDSLKEKLAQLRNELTSVQDAYDDLQTRAREMANKEQELRVRAQDAKAAFESEHAARLKAEKNMHGYGDEVLEAQDEAKALRREMEKASREAKADLAEKDSALQESQVSLRSLRNALEQREQDLAAVQAALESLESEKRKLGESATTDRFSLELEVDRLKRDLARCQSDLDLAQEDVKDKERRRREAEAGLDKLNAELREVSNQLSSQTQARLNLGEKLDAAQSNVKQAEADLLASKNRVAELEARLNKDQRAMLSSENQYRDQLTERNTLLLTIYQYMEKILGPEKGLKTGTAPETKPYTNFTVFHDNIISRLKAVSQIQLDFDQRAKNVQARFDDKLTELKRQLDHRWKQVDKFEASVKKLSDEKALWRKKLSTKDVDLENSKALNSELSSQVSALKRMNATPNSPSLEVRGLKSQIRNLEQRINQAQNLNGQLEDRIKAQLDISSKNDDKQNMRWHEYERLLKEANEKYKREKQGSKERVGELEATIRSLQKQIDLTTRRTQQLQEVASSGKGSK